MSDERPEMSNPVAFVLSGAKPAPIRDPGPPPGGPPSSPRANEAADPGSHGLEPVGYGKLPEDCPIVPIGRLSQTFYFLDADRQLIELKARELNKSTIAALFGRHISRAASFLAAMDEAERAVGAPLGW